MKKTVYLAGPILGCDKSEANDWRAEVAAQLAEADVVGISPLRCEPLIGERYKANYDDLKFGTARAIGSKNIFDVRTCDMTLAYLPRMPEGRHQSYGTLIELGWAHILNRPAIVVTDDTEVETHPVVNFCANWILPTLDEAVEVAIGTLGGYAGGKNI